MNVELPATGCNILISESQFYNYFNDNYNRDTYSIYQGVAYKTTSSVSSMRPYEYTGTCLNTGDLVYKPELQVYFPVICFGLICLALALIYNIIFKRFIK